MDKNEVADVLNNIGMLLELKGDNVFKVRAYYDAARVIENMEDDLEAIVKEGRLGEVKGFGSALITKITELVTTGRLEYYEKLKSEFPSGLLDLFRLQGLGPKKIGVLYRELNIQSIEQLKEACLENRLISLKGFGEKTQQKILESIINLERYAGSFHYYKAMQTAELILGYIEESGMASRCNIAGDLRRKMETVNKIELVAAGSNPAGLLEYVSGMDAVKKVTGNDKNSINIKKVASSDKNSISVMPAGGIETVITVVSEEQYPYVLFSLTGSRGHAAQMKNMANRLGFEISEYGIYRDGNLVRCADEKDIYNLFGMQYIPPELRENNGEIEAALSNKIPTLVDASEIQGIIHVHTRYSDGHNSIEDLVIACRGKGYSYLGIADHSRSAYYAGGLKIDDIKRQHEEINMINAKYEDFMVLKGIESDILPDGSLDYDDDILSMFDFIIASVHSSFGMSEDKMTERIIKAIKNKHVSILGHPMGRLLLMRDSYKVNIDEVISAAAQEGVIIEINANPYRLDLDWRYLRQAGQAGCKVVICPDAHSIPEIDYVVYGINTARKGWLTAETVINTYPADEFLSVIRSRRA